MNVEMLKISNQISCPVILGFLDRFVESKQGCISHKFTGKDSTKVSIFAVDGGVIMSRA